MRCIGLTRKIKRCKNNCKFVFCHDHKIQWWGIIVIIATIGGLFQDIIKPIGESISKFSSKKEKINNIIFTSDSTFNVLILSLTPDQNCINQVSNFDNIIMRHFEEFREQEKLKFNLDYTDRYNCPNSVNTTRKIGEDNNATLVIWGYYDENCSGEIKLRIRYTLVSKITLIDKEFGDSGFTTIKDLDQLRNGDLLKEIDYTLLKNLATYEYHKKKYSECLRVIKKIENYRCDVELLSMLSISYFEENNSSESVYNQDSALECIMNDLKPISFNLQNLTYEEFLKVRETNNRIVAFIEYTKSYNLYEKYTLSNNIKIRESAIKKLNEIELICLQHKLKHRKFGKKMNWQ